MLVSSCDTTGIWHALKTASNDPGTLLYTFQVLFSNYRIFNEASRHCDILGIYERPYRDFTESNLQQAQDDWLKCDSFGKTNNFNARKILWNQARKVNCEILEQDPSRREFLTIKRDIDIRDERSDDSIIILFLELLMPSKT